MGATAVGYGRPDGTFTGRERKRGEADRGRGGGDGIRSGSRSVAQSEGLETGRGRIHIALYHAPHRERWMVDGHPGQRGRRALPGIPRRRKVATEGAGNTICRLCRMATELVAGRGAGATTQLLEAAVERGADRARITRRPATPPDTKLSGGVASACHLC